MDAPYIAIAVLVALVLAYAFYARNARQRAARGKAPARRPPVRRQEAPADPGPGGSGTIVEYDRTDALGWIELDEGGRVRFGATSLRGISRAEIGARVQVHGTKPGHNGVPKAVAVTRPGERPPDPAEAAPAVKPPSGPPADPGRPYDRVRITNMADGTTIEGHDAVAAYFEKEQKLLDEHGENIIFEVYRVNLGAKTLGDLQGEKIAEVKVGGGFASGTDTVAAVKKKVRSLLARPDVSIRKTERISFSFSGRRMLDDKRFYADHYMMLPVWVQVLLHECEVEELLALADKLRSTN